MQKHHWLLLLPIVHTELNTLTFLIMAFLASLGHFKGLMYNDDVIIDDPIFRLHYGFTTLLLLFSSLLVTGTIYLGEPIQCTLAYQYWHYMIPKPMLNIYCYIHSTFVIPQAGTASINEQLYPYPGVGHVENSSGKIHTVIQIYLHRCRRKL